MFKIIANEGRATIKLWCKGVPFDAETIKQVTKLSSLPFIEPHIAIMPDAHVGIGATVGSVVPTVGAIIPSAVGVDIGCGMCAVKTSLHANDLPQGSELRNLRLEIEKNIPHGRTSSGKANHDEGSWALNQVPHNVEKNWVAELDKDYKLLTKKYSVIGSANSISHLGTLGTGNHFVELCLDESDQVWCLLHSGSRGIGNKIGTHFIAAARKEIDRLGIRLEDPDFSYLKEGTKVFEDYIFAVHWAQKFASINRKLMMEAFISTLSSFPGIPSFQKQLFAVNCHHNYVQIENHFGKQVYLTRKGAVSAKSGEFGIIPGSMGAKTYIVRGKGNPESFHSCSHGAGRVMSRTEAKKKVSLKSHLDAVSHVECKKDASIIDETPSAYKDIDAVMEAQKDLVDVVHTLRQILCVKGFGSNFARNNGIKFGLSGNVALQIAKGLSSIKWKFSFIPKSINDQSMEQKAFLQSVFQSDGIAQFQNGVIKVKKTYQGNRTLFTSNGRGSHSRIKLKCKNPGVTFQYTNQTAEWWEVRVSAQTIRSTVQALRLRDIDWDRDDEDEILEKLENPYMSLLRAREFYAQLDNCFLQIQELTTRIIQLEGYLSTLTDNPSLPPSSFPITQQSMIPAPLVVSIAPPSILLNVNSNENGEDGGTIRDFTQNEIICPSSQPPNYESASQSSDVSMEDSFFLGIPDIPIRMPNFPSDDESE